VHASHNGRAATYTISVRCTSGIYAHRQAGALGWWQLARYCTLRGSFEIGGTLAATIAPYSRGAERKGPSFGMLRPANSCAPGQFGRYWI